MFPTENNSYNSLLQQAIKAACKVAQIHGISCHQAIVLSHQANVVIHLHPSPVVARVATTTGTVRQGNTWLKRELKITQHLAKSGAPIVPPSSLISPQIYKHQGLFLSFWEFVEILKEPVNPVIVGQKLQECHAALLDFPGELPILEPIKESQHILPQLIAKNAFNPADAELLQKVCETLTNKLETQVANNLLKMQPVHGDANFSNVLNTTQGVLWTDWEDTFIGWLEWDLACLIARSHIIPTEIEKASAALQGYGKDIDQNLLNLLVETRMFQTVLWNFIMASQDSQSLERMQMRLQWLRQRFN
ncbi:stress response kinase A [Calothrix sp. NIES-4101]|nr:stress response kinase A [Calothrix sp. NIES-4101]